MLNLIQHPLQKGKPYNKHEIPNQVRNDGFFESFQQTTDNQQQRTSIFHSSFLILN